MTDEELIRLLLAGDPATDRAVRVWIRTAASPYRLRLGDSLEDMEQDMLLELTAALREGRFDGRSQLRTYVRRAVHFKCIDRLRADGRREVVDIADLDLPSAAPSALDRMSATQETRLALRVLAAMPADCREMWRMIEQGLSYREMSRRLGVAEGALRTRVHRCRQRALETRERFARELPGGAPTESEGHRPAKPPS